MELSFSELRAKEVVNTQDGRRLGRVCDVVLCYPENKWVGLIVPSGRGFGRKNEIFIGLMNIVKIFKKRELAVAGSFNAIAEFFVIFASINLLPVSFVSLFNRLSVPIVMLISAYYFKEQTIRNQLIFGILALLLALPLILIR